MKIYTKSNTLRNSSIRDERKFDSSTDHGTNLANRVRLAQDTLCSKIIVHSLRIQDEFFLQVNVNERKLLSTNEATIDENLYRRLRTTCRYFITLSTEYSHCTLRKAEALCWSPVSPVTTHVYSPRSPMAAELMINCPSSAMDALRLKSCRD